MPAITYVAPDHKEHTVTVDIGMSVMEGAIRGDVPGIDADCGGACACGTCHVRIAADWFAVTGGPATEDEEAMLELADEVGPTSRLACQIVVTAELEGLIVHVAG